MTNSLWLNWFERRSIFQRFPAVIYLVPFMVGSLLWRLGQVHWAWWEREGQMAPLVLVFCVGILLVLKRVTMRFTYVVRGKKVYLISLILLLVGGFIYTGYHWNLTALPGSYLHRVSGTNLETKAGERTILIRGRITQISEDKYGLTLTVRPLAVYSADGEIRLPRLHGQVQMVRTSLTNLPTVPGRETGDSDMNIPLSLAHQIKLGDQFIFKGPLSLITPATNPGQFDYQRYQRYRRIIAQMVNGEGYFVFRPEFDFMRWLDTGKSWAERFFERNISTENQPFLMALFTGETDYLTDAAMQQIRNLGLSHIIAISGLHLSLVVVWLRKVLQWCRVPRKFFLVFLVSGIWIAVFFAGSQPSALRVGIYLTLAEIGNLLGRRVQPLNLLAVTAWIILLWNPLTLFLLSFQLSFVTYLALMVLYKPVNQLLEWFFPQGPLFLKTVQQSLAMSGASFVGSAPIVLFAFYQLPVQGILMNLWAVPLSEVILMLLLFTLPIGALLPPLGGFLALPLDKLVGLFNLLVKISSAALGQVWQPGRPLVFWIVSFYLVFLMFYRLYQYSPFPAMWFRRERRLAKDFFLVVLLLGLFLPLLVSVWHILPDGLEWIILDIGQGDGMFLRLPGGFTMLVDGGGQLTGENFAGEKIVKPFLLSRGIRKIDLVCITHGDADHARGLLPVLSEFTVRRIWMPEASKSSFTRQIKDIAKKRGIPISYPVQGDILHLKQVMLEVLHPAKGEFHASENDQSLVLRLSYSRKRILLMGDLSGKEEESLLAAGIAVSADFLKIAHHGSKYSTTTDFLQTVNPQIAVISVGKNRYGHPAPETLDRLTTFRNSWSGLHCPVIRTDESGAIRILFKGNDVQLQRFKGAS